MLAINPAYTRQKCACCGHTVKGNRQSQSEFVCLECGYKENADINGDRHILAAGHAALACGEMTILGRSMKHMRFATAQGFNTAEQFYTYLKDSFDVLYEEGEHASKMMSVGMHCRLLGRPSRFRALQRFLDYIQQHEKVWICTRQQIANHWRKEHPFER